MILHQAALVSRKISLGSAVAREESQRLPTVDPPEEDFGDLGSRRHEPPMQSGLNTDLKVQGALPSSKGLRLS